MQDEVELGKNISACRTITYNYADVFFCSTKVNEAPRRAPEEPRSALYLLHIAQNRPVPGLSQSLINRSPAALLKSPVQRDIAFSLARELNDRAPPRPAGVPNRFFQRNQRIRSRIRYPEHVRGLFEPQAMGGCEIRLKYIRETCDRQKVKYAPAIIVRYDEDDRGGELRQ